MVNRFTYSILTYLWIPFEYFRMWRKGKQSPDYRKRWAERWGFFKAPKEIQNGICFHCVSVGETIAATPLIKMIQKKYPNCPITITTTTPTGSAQVKLAFGNSVFHVYMAFDMPDAAKRFLAKIRPKLLVILETELWPNLLHYSQVNNVKVILANARLSEKSLMGYKRFSTLSFEMMKNLDLIAVQNQQDGQRFYQLGLEQHKLKIVGNIKFDLELDLSVKKESLALKKDWVCQRPVWVAGSVHFDEIESILEAFNKVLIVFPKTLLVLVPRHPEYFYGISEIIKQANFAMVKRSEFTVPDSKTQVMLGDSMGELMLFWGMADVAFVGGSLIERGGHNPLEPALCSLPVLSGPNVFNFREIYQLLISRKAAIITENSDQLAENVIDLIQDKTRRDCIGKNAFRVVEENRGALPQLISEVEKLLSLS
jgi:3-deoxy-D-manno-octulosonic-acid transferase